MLPHFPWAEKIILSLEWLCNNASWSLFLKYKFCPFRLYHSLLRNFSFSVQFSSVAQSCPTLCDTMNCSTPSLSVHHQLPESTQTHVHWVDDAIQPSHPLSPPSPALNLSQHQSFPISWLFASGGQSIETSASASVLPVNIQDWFPLGFTSLISLLFSGLSRVFSSTIHP